MTTINLYRLNYLVYCGCDYGQYESRYVVLARKVSSIEALAVVSATLGEGEEVSTDDIYEECPCVGIGNHGELLWGEAE